MKHHSKLTLLLSICYLFFSAEIMAQEESASGAAELLIEGKYNGKNLVIYNPSVTETENCIQNIFVNGGKINFPANSNSFEIPLNGSANGQLVSIHIQHHESCTPVVVNANDITKIKEFHIGSFAFVKRSKLLTWNLTDLDSAKTYVLEQYLYGKWKEIKQLGAGSEVIFNTYPPTLNSGTNFFRLKEIDAQGKILVSPVVQAKIPNRKIEIAKLKVSKTVDFSDVTHYEIYDKDGFFVKEGTSKTIDVSELKKGDYFLNYDGKQAVINKK